MKRKRIALLTACAVVVLCVVVVWGNWRWIAYDRVRDRDDGLYFLKKRAEWLLGVERLVPDQVCTWCIDPEDVCGKHSNQNWNHVTPPDGSMFTTLWIADDSDVTPLPENHYYRCICQQCFPGRKAR